MKMFKPTILVLMLATGAAHAANGLPPLQENKRVRSEFLSAAIGDEIRENCPTIQARDGRVQARALKLVNYALGLGYSWSDIHAMRKDPAAKAELKRLRDAYLARNGVTAGDPDSYCRLGLAEIQKNTLTGWLLQAN